MNEADIKELYQEVINQKGIEKKLDVDRKQIYNLRKRTLNTVGNMVEILFQLDAIKITKKK